MINMLMFILLVAAVIMNLVTWSLGWHRIRRAKQREDQFINANHLLLQLCMSAWTLREHKPLGLAYKSTVGEWWKAQDME